VSHELIGDREEHKGVVDERNDGGSIDISLRRQSNSILSVQCWSR